MTLSVTSKAADALAEMMNIFKSNREGKKQGVYSVCASHALVLEATMHQALKDDSILLVEATANQVNQFGGYTGMIPADFPADVFRLADTTGLSRDRIVLGGDHLGPLCWTDESVDDAMAKACDLVAAYVEAGFKKIHLDASMACGGEDEPLSDEIVARRAVMLCQAAEQAASVANMDVRPVYVIGTEVPVPGGATEGMEGLEATSVERAQHTIEAHRSAFAEAGLKDAWQRVIALVVQPGVEFNHTEIHGYDSSKAQALSESILRVPGLVYEAHSTDYQPHQAYGELVRDHFAILKVGPQLTFALREALFALVAIEEELVAEERQSGLLDVCERVMLAEPIHWIKHYPNEGPEARLYRRYSYSDRIRYYWPHPEISGAVEVLMTNLENVDVPLPLLSQYLPDAYAAVCAGTLTPSPRELVINHIMAVSSAYSEACQENA